MFDYWREFTLKERVVGHHEVACSIACRWAGLRRTQKPDALVKPIFSTGGVVRLPRRYDCSHNGIDCRIIAGGKILFIARKIDIERRFESQNNDKHLAKISTVDCRHRQGTVVVCPAEFTFRNGTQQSLNTCPQGLPVGARVCSGLLRLCQRGYPVPLVRRGLIGKGLQKR